MEEIRNKAGPEHTGTSLYNATYDPGDANPTRHVFCKSCDLEQILGD